MDKFKSENMLGSMTFMIDGVDLENNRIPVILSDETEVVRYSWDDGKYYLTLKHGEDNVDLSRKDILSLFVNHSTHELPIGIFEDVRLEDNKLKAWAVFDSEDEDSMKIFRKLSRGFLKSFSVGIDVITKVLTKEEDGVKYYDVTEWAISEASVVGIPAIPNAKVGLKDEELGSKPAKVEASVINQKQTQGNTMTDIELQALKDNHAEALKTVGADSLKVERKRVGDILSLQGDADIKHKSIEDGLSAGDTAIALNKSLNATIVKNKTDFEKAAEELAGENAKSDDGKDLSDEQLKEKEADEALDSVGGNK
jgi:HK97 family phage prohead protease